MLRRTIRDCDPHNDAVISIIEDDAYVREGLVDFLRMRGVDVRSFGSAEDFLAHGPRACACLICDVRLPGASGLDLQAALKKRNAHIPIVFISGHGDAPSVIRAWEDGAVKFLEKPVDGHQLAAIVRSILKQGNERARFAARVESLTAREREVVELTTKGLHNKAIAAELKLSIGSVGAYRHGAFRKLDVASLAELISMWGQK